MPPKTRRSRRTGRNLATPPQKPDEATEIETELKDYNVKFDLRKDCESGVYSNDRMSDVLFYKEFNFIIGISKL